MKKEYFIKILVILMCYSPIAFEKGYGQVGINNATPEGLLDLGNNSTMGVIYPVTSLTDVTIETLSNPNGGTLAAGTCVYNTNTAGSGEDSVYPGIYIWTGSKWIPQFNKKDSEVFTQDSDLRTGSDDILNPVLGDQALSFDSSSFTPKFSGPYRVALTLHYGAGTTNEPSGDQHVNYAAGSGDFDFTFNGTTSTYKMKSYSGLNDDKLFKGGSGATMIEYNNSIKQSTYIIEETLTRNVPYSFTLTFNQDDLEGFEGDGDISVIPAGDGRGYIVSIGDFNCTVEITYVGE
ncbi:MAG TPA: hypothetical protein EYN07_03620 [Flavobacteriaceae bacterium]|nr:hypothetical protein [Flavobacteriaceae bacterium]HIN98310.1 hypothetical protein [Flavobacteriaceae bacterium]